VIFSEINKKPLAKMITPEGEETHSVRVLKGKAESSYEVLKLMYKDDDAPQFLLLLLNRQFFRKRNCCK